MPTEGEAKPSGSGKGARASDGRRAALSLGTGCPTSDGGTTFDGRVIDPVVSVDGTSATAGAGLERDVQPAKTTRADRVAERNIERMSTRTQDNHPWRRVSNRAGANYSCKITEKG